MEKKEYTKIKLRDFRQKLTSLKDSLSYGEMYEITQRGKSIAYFIPSEYEIQIQRKRRIDKTRRLLKLIRNISNSIPQNIKDRLEKDGTYKKLYREELDKKYKVK